MSHVSGTFEEVCLNLGFFSSQDSKEGAMAEEEKHAENEKKEEEKGREAEGEREGDKTETDIGGKGFLQRCRNVFQVKK